MRRWQWWQDDTATTLDELVAAAQKRGVYVSHNEAVPMAWTSVTIPVVLTKVDSFTWAIHPQPAGWVAQQVRPRVDGQYDWVDGTGIRLGDGNTPADELIAHLIDVPSD